MNSFGAILSRLQNIQQRGNGFVACCPAHDDKEPSLSLDTGDNGKILLKCHAGCTFEEIVNALGLKPADLMGGGNNTPSNNTATAQLPGCTLAEYAELKKLPVSFLQEVGCRDASYMSIRAVRISYRDVTGEEISVQFRVALRKGEHGDTRFRRRKGDKACLYGLWRLNPKPEHIVLVEGPSDCHTLWFHDISALGMPSASSFKEEWSDSLDGIPVIYVVIEPDKGGETVKKWLAKSKLRKRVRLISLGEYKDPSGLHLDNPEQFAARFQRYLEAAMPWTDQEALEAEVKKNQA